MVESVDAPAGAIAPGPGRVYHDGMFEALSKYVDLLKASGWQTGTIALAAGMFLYLSQAGVLPPMEPWMLLIGWVVVFLFGALSAASLATACQRGVQAVWGLWKGRQERLAWEAKIIGDIPTMTDHERRILGYLRHHRLRTFDTDLDGGYANTLFAKGYLLHVAGTKAIDRRRVPTFVADDVWRIINERPQDFPHVEQWSQPGASSSRVEVEPWRIPWNLR